MSEVEAREVLFAKVVNGVLDAHEGRDEQRKLFPNFVECRRGWQEGGGWRLELCE